MISAARPAQSETTPHLLVAHTDRPAPSHRRTWLASSCPPSYSDAIFWSLISAWAAGEMCVAIPSIAGLACRSSYSGVCMLHHGSSSCHPAGAQRTGCAREQALSGWRWRVRGVLAEEVLQGVLPRGCPGTRWGHARWSGGRLQGPSTASASASRLQRAVHYLGGG